ncbi:MAG: alpha/beta fold hydrolase [Haliangium ochraceum]
MLCLHGFTGTPFELHPLADDLAGRGYLVEAPTLAGHGTDVAALESTGWRDWLRSAEDAFDALAARTPGRVAIVGCSMGGLLALRLARSHPQRVSALAVLSVPLWLRAPHERGIRFLAAIPRALRWGPLRALPKIFGSNVSDLEMRRRNPTLRAMPISALNSLVDLMEVVRADLPAIRTSALVVHGRHDRTVPIASSVALADRLALAFDGPDAAPATTGPGGGPSPRDPRPVLQRLWLERSCHLVGIDVEREALNATVARFFAEHARWQH